MKICFVFTPFYKPNSFPLGIAYLKSYLQKNIPGIKVKNIDLNVRFFNRALRATLGNLCETCQSDNLFCTPPEILLGLNAKKVGFALKRKFSTKKEFFYFLQNSLKFKWFYAAISGCFQPVLKNYLEHNVLSDKWLKVLKEDVQTIISQEANIVGFSIINEKNLAYSLSLAKLIKSITDIPIIFGGATMAHLNSEEMLNAFQFIDFIVEGEGEIAVLKFLENFKTGKFEGVPNLSYRAGKKIISNKKIFVQDLDKLPFPDFSDFNQKDYLIPENVIPILSLRGCYWSKCTFCIHPLFYPKAVRTRSIKNVVDEIEYQKSRLHVKNFIFADESVPPKRMLEISREIIRRNISIIYGFKGVRPEKGFTYALLKNAHRSGLRTIYLGVESVTQRILDKMKKGTDVKVALRIINDCYKIGIKPLISYMIAFPTQTAEELKKECAFLKKYEIDAAYTMFHVLKGSEIADKPHRFHVKPKSTKVLFDINGLKIHSRAVESLPQKGLSRREALEILKESKLSLNRYSLDEITNIFASSYKFSVNDIQKEFLKRQ